MTRRICGGFAGWYADQNAWMAGRIDASGWRARATSRPGSTGSTIGTEPTQHAQVLRQHAADVERRIAAPRELPVDQQHAGPAPSARRRQREAVLPAQIGVHDPAVAVRAAQLLEPFADELAGLDARQQILRSRAEIEHELVGRLGKLETPDRGVRQIRPQPVQGRQRAAEDAGRNAGEAPLMLAPIARAARRAQDEAGLARLEMHDRRHVPRQLRAHRPAAEARPPRAPAPTRRPTSPA